jgi:hypothetical protein
MQGDRVILSAMSAGRRSRRMMSFASLRCCLRISCVHGDRFAGEWPRERFKVHGI